VCMQHIYIYICVCVCLYERDSRELERKISYVLSHV
jgi:hypothetical protein